MNLQQSSNDLTEAVGVQFQEAFAHLRIIDEGVIGFLVHEVVHGTTCGTPAEGEVEALGHFTHTFITRVEHALVPLGIQQLGA